VRIEYNLYITDIATLPLLNEFSLLFRDERALSRRDVVDALLSTHVTGDRAEKGLRFQVGESYVSRAPL
jgi:hypothetical protein